MKPSRRTLIVGGGAAAAAALGGTWLTRRRLTMAASRSLAVEPVDAIPPAEDGEDALDLLVVGDTGKDTDVRREVVARMDRAVAERPARLVVLTGDNAYPEGFTSAEDPTWRTHFDEAFAPLLARGLPFYPCLGNHDHMGSVQAQVDYSRRHPQWRLPAPYHRFDEALGTNGAAVASFFVLDTMPLRQERLHLFARLDQVAWLDEELATASASTWKLAIGHHPLHSGGTRGGSSKVRWNLIPSFARGELDFYLSGHNHDLELLDADQGWFQVVSGAGALPRAVEAIDETRWFAAGGGFCRLSLRADEAWLRFEPLDAAPATFRFRRLPRA